LSTEQLRACQLFKIYLVTAYMEYVSKCLRELALICLVSLRFTQNFEIRSELEVNYCLSLVW
jgi:hypothetical protein